MTATRRMNMFFSPLLAIILVLAMSIVSQEYCQASPFKFSDDDPVPNVPEPMVFDLVRPLGAPKGEIEVNSLFMQPLSGRNRRFSWEPEAEFALGRGYAIEPQVIFANGQFEGFQVTGQKTLGTFWKNKVIHGILIRNEFILDDKQLANDFAYLIGARLSKHWSAFCISGLRRQGYWGGGEFVGLLNPSVFYHCNPKLVVGVETNLRLGEPITRRQLITPQFQWSFREQTQIQAGLGFAFGGQEPSSVKAIWRTVWQVK